MNLKSLYKPLVMFAGLFVAGAVFSVLGALAGSRLLTSGPSGWEGLIGGILGMVLGIPLGVIIGLVLAKTMFKYPGSLLLGIPAALAGSGLVMLLAEPLGLNQIPAVLIASIFTFSPLLATAGYHLKR